MKKPSFREKIIDDPTRVLTLANFISLLRALSAIPIIYTLSVPHLNWISPILILVSAFSDVLDGYFARRAHEVTHLGKWLDPVADFVVIVSVAAYLVLSKSFPAWFFIFYVGRHFIIAALAVYCMNHDHYILEANWWGKWATGLAALGLFLHIYDYGALPWLKIVSLYVSTVLLLVSAFRYFKDYYLAMNKIRAQQAV